VRNGLRRLGLALVSVLGAAATATATAQEPDKFRFPPPELGPDYRQPETAFPAVRELLPPLADAAVLALALGLAAFLVHRHRRRSALLALTIAGVAWFGWLREGCICPVGSLQNVAQATADPNAPILVATILFFVLPLAAALFTGRTFCSGVCPLGAIQELVLLRPLRLPHWLAAGLSVLPVVYLLLAVLFAATGAGYLICRYDPFVGLFRLSATTNMLVVGGSLLVIAVFVGRPYCRFLCPYSVLLDWASRLSTRTVTISPVGCATCRLCEDRCPYDAILVPNAAAVAKSRLRGRTALVLLLAATPLLVAGMAWAGTHLGPWLASAHPRVALAEQVEAEQQGRARETTDASDVFRASGEKIEALLADAEDRRGTMALGSGIAGACLGLWLGLRLVGLGLRRTRRDYTADPATCLACGRCYEWCPVELERRRTGRAPEVRG